MLNINFKFLSKIKNFIFPFYKHKDLKLIFKKLHEDTPHKKINTKFVGGCVRKYLLGEEIDDIDLATTLTTDEVKKRFIDTKFKIIDTGLKHGTVTLVTQKFKLEITTLRKDVETDGRHATIEYTDDWVKDSERRDFTINAIYLDIFGKIYDPQSGVLDLKNKKIKFIGDPHKRIEEDYLRIIRFIRFSIQYQNEIDKPTLDAIKLNLDGIKKISKERILIELMKIFKLKNFYLINKFDDLKSIFLLIFPEIRYLDRLKKIYDLDDVHRTNIINKLGLLTIDHSNNHEYFCHKYKTSKNIYEKLKLLANEYLEMKKDNNYFTKNLKKKIIFLR